MTNDIAELEALESRLILEDFSQSDAWRLGSIAVRRIQENGGPLAVQIVIGEHIVFKAALNGVSDDTDSWLAGKAAAARHFQSSSFLVRLRNDRDPSVSAGLDDDAIRTHGGSVPIVVRGIGIVGTITTSGAPDTVDHAIAIGALEEFVNS